jgi:hypothetical protein
MVAKIDISRRERSDLVGGELIFRLGPRQLVNQLLAKQSGRSENHVSHTGIVKEGFLYVSLALWRQPGWPFFSQRLQNQRAADAEAEDGAKSDDFEHSLP